MEEETFIKAGGMRVYPNSRLSDIEEEIGKASNVKIRLMDSYIPQILDTKSKTQWRTLLNDALKRGCKLDILVLSPDETGYIANRSRQLDRPEFKANIGKCIDYFKGLKMQYGKSVEIRTFWQCPIGPVTIVGTTLYQGFFLQGKRAVECPIIKVDLTKGGSFKEFEDAFQRVWETGNIIT